MSKCNETLTANASWNEVQILQILWKSHKGYAPVYIPHFGQISVKFSVLRVLYPYRCTDGGEIWHGGGDLLRAKFHPHRYNVSPLWGENPQNRPLNKLNNRRFALRAMLPVNNLNDVTLQPAATRLLSWLIDNEWSLIHLKLKKWLCTSERIFLLIVLLLAALMVFLLILSFSNNASGLVQYLLTFF